MAALLYFPYNQLAHKFAYKAQIIKMLCGLVDQRSNYRYIEQLKSGFKTSEKCLTPT